MPTAGLHPEIPLSPVQPFVLRLKLDTFSQYSDYKAWGIFAYPKSKNPDTEIYLYTPTPGLVSYVLGDGWEGRLGTSNAIYEDWPTCTEEETALATRILRAGGAALDLSGVSPEERYEVLHEAVDREWSRFEKQRKCIFGWPATGGVWVLHLTPPTITLDTEEGEEAIEEMMGLVAMEEQPEEALRVMTEGHLNLKKLRRAESMAEYCAELKALGGEFYEDPGASAEVRESGLLDPSQLWR